MNVLILFLALCFWLGGSRWSGSVRNRPILLLGLATVFAASFYSLRVVL